ncbi:hypothetical protein [Paraburkholderia fungorum]|uniref:hypothetical protein n=1 Tax=Paraburkholderia fungorum TaxID=134537 RepID=UPI0038B7827C
MIRYKKPAVLKAGIDWLRFHELCVARGLSIPAVEFRIVGRFAELDILHPANVICQHS